MEFRQLGEIKPRAGLSDSYHLLLSKAENKILRKTGRDSFQQQKPALRIIAY